MTGVIELEDMEFYAYHGCYKEEQVVGNKFKVTLSMTVDCSLAAATDDFDVSDCFQVLKEVSQTVCPTVISMVFDVTEKTVYWCFDRNYNRVENKKF